MSPPNEQPVLFLWSFSPWASKIVAYLALRNIPHSRCEQPIWLPRPDLAALGVSYRRIPVLSIGRDIYCDTLLIIEKLEQLYPASEQHPAISAGSEGTYFAIERLLEKWTDVCVFGPAAAAIPTHLDLMKDENFIKDREELWGRPWSKEEQDRLRPGGLATLRANFDFLESVLKDGRDWILGGSEGPKLADIHACWIFDWMYQLEAFPKEFFSAEKYPRTTAWRERYFAAIADVKEKTANNRTELKGEEAVTKILSGGFNDAETSSLNVEADPEENLQKGQSVEIYPTDTGFKHRDQGELVGLNAAEVVVLTRSRQDDSKEIRIHYPRWNIKVEPVT